MNKKGEIKLVVMFLIGILLLGSLVVTALYIDNTNNVQSSTYATESTQLSTPTLSSDQAISIATSIISGTVEEIEFEKINGRLLYSVEIENSQGEFDIKIDPYTGEVVKVEQETSVGIKELELLIPKVSEDQAKAIALTRVKGTVKEIEIEKVNGNYMYQVEITKSGSEYEVSIDIMTGQILSVEEEIEEDVSNVNSPISKNQAIEIAEKCIRQWLWLWGNRNWIL